MDMMFQFSIYFLSFVPLWISILFADVISCLRNDNYLHTEMISMIVILAGLILSTIVTWNKLSSKRAKRKQNTENYVIKSAKEERFGAAEFLMAYVLPFFAFDFTLWDGMVLFLIFFFVLWILVYRHKYYCVNFIMEIFGYRVYKCELKNGNRQICKYVVSRQQLEMMCGDSIKTRKFNNDYHFEIRELDRESSISADSGE